MSRDRPARFFTIDVKNVETASFGVEAYAVCLT